MIEDQPSVTRRQPLALEGWIHDILYCDPKESRAFLRILSTENLQKGEMFAHVGQNQTLENQTVDACREPFAVKDWTPEILHCDPNESKAFLWILSTEGCGIRLCWAHSKWKP